jgi:hypothetical protein
MCTPPDGCRVRATALAVRVILELSGLAGCVVAGTWPREPATVHESHVNESHVPTSAYIFKSGAPVVAFNARRPLGVESSCVVLAIGGVTPLARVGLLHFLQRRVLRR